MDQIYPDSTLLPVLTKLIISGWDYHLFTAPASVTLATVIGSFTEAAWAGYAVQNVPLAAFTLQSVVSHLGTFQAAPVGFLNSSGAPVTAQGFYVTDHGTGNLVCCAVFDNAPVTIPNGQSWFVVPIASCFSALAV